MRGGGGHDGLEHVLGLAGRPAQAQAAVRVAGGGGVGGARPVQRPAPALPPPVHRTKISAQDMKENC